MTKDSKYFTVIIFFTITLCMLPDSNVFKDGIYQILALMVESCDILIFDKKALK